MVRALLESCPAVAFIKDTQGRYTLINDAAAEFLSRFGRSREDALGKTDRDLLPAQLADAYATADQKVLDEQSPLQIEEHSPDSHGGRGSWRLSIRFPVRDSRGSICGIAGVCADITGYKVLQEQLAHRAELLEQQTHDLTRANNDLSDFTHIAAHDLKEPLRGIRLSIGMLREDAYGRLTSDDLSRLASIDGLATRMHDLLDAVLRYSRLIRTHPRAVPTDLGLVVAEVFRSLQATLKERGARVELPAEGLPTVVCDPELMAEVFSNLILNGMYYNTAADKIVRISSVLCGGTPVMCVSDNGVGIRPEHFGFIFQMFRRLKNPPCLGQGTGVGLTIAKRIIESHGGQIWLESQPGRGTTFYFTLGPQADQGPCALEPSSPTTPAYRAL